MSQVLRFRRDRNLARKNEQALANDNSANTPLYKDISTNVSPCRITINRFSYSDCPDINLLVGVKQQGNADTEQFMRTFNEEVVWPDELSR
jgi:hypothetical protein